MLPLRAGVGHRILPAMTAGQIPSSASSRPAPRGRLRRTLRHGLAALFLALFCGLGPVQAQAQTQDRPDDPPYEQDLMRLSEILGALHYLRPLCGSPDGSLWRDEMQALLEAEVQDDERRRRFVERFNQGYRGYSSVYRRCTPAAEAALNRYVSEGSALVRSVTTRYNR